MGQEKPPKRPKTRGEALAEVYGILHQILQGGPADTEADSLNEIKRALESGVIEPEEAVRRAHEIEETRQQH